MHDLDHLIEGARSLLAERGYSASTISHHGRLVTYDRESYRVKHALMRGEL